jgi:hypothetical protein
MRELTGRPHPERSDSWHVYYGDVQVGTIAVQSGLRHTLGNGAGIAGSIRCHIAVARARGYADEARAGFERAWTNYLPRCTEADFDEYRRERAWTAWKYAMYAAGLQLPTQSTSGQARCFCGATIDMAVTDRHVHDAHMDSEHA